LIVSRKIAEMFKQPGFVNIDYLVKNKLEKNPSKILNILNRDWRKWVKPVCMRDDGDSLDPNFGYKTKGDAYETERHELIGSWFSCPEAGTANSITVFLNWQSGNPKVKYGTYKKSDGALVDYTEEWTVTNNWVDWKTLNIIWGGALVATDYWLIAWFSGYDVGFQLSFDVANKGAYMDQTYGSFPSTFVPGSYDNHKHCIYCTYTSAAPPPKPKGTIAIHAKIVGVI
jgi:hypothetical protein